MFQPVKSLVYGVTDPNQALEVGLLGIDGVVVRIGPARDLDDEAPIALEATDAARLVAQLPPLAARLALVEPASEHASTVLPVGFSGSVAARHCARPRGSAAHVVRLDHDELELDYLPEDADAIWIRPRLDVKSSATAFDYEEVKRWSKRTRVILEIPDGPAGVETAMRLGRPYAVLFGAGVSFKPGLIELDRLEDSMAVVARVNRVLAASV